MSPADSDTTTTRATQLTVWALCATLTAATVALLLALAPIDAPAGRLQLPWWLLVAAFAVTELGVVHIHVRRSAHSLTLAEIPLVLGLMFAAPTHVIAAWTIGAGAVLLRPRRAYNLTRSTAQISASMGLALADSGTLNADELVRNADTAMYVCKHDGKHGLTIHDHPQQAEPLSVTGIDAASRKHSTSHVPTSAHNPCDVTQAARASDLLQWVSACRDARRVV